MSTQPLLPPKTHANYLLWANYAKFAPDRGVFVKSVLSRFVEIQDLLALDLGCGSGGTSLALAKAGARVTAVDANHVRIQEIKCAAKEINLNIRCLAMNAHTLHFRPGTFDCIVMQDVLEHLENPEQAVKEVHRVLKRGGIIYLSTPNRWSPLNFISDPHWNLPVVSVLPRKAVRNVTTITKREERERQGLGVLLSLWKVISLFKRHDIELQFVNRFAADALFRTPNSIVNSNLHLSVVKALRQTKADKLLRNMVNDRFGFFNYLINPTWYLIGYKI